MLRKGVVVVDENASNLLKKKIQPYKPNEKSRPALGEVGNLVSLKEKLPEKKLTKGNTTLNKLIKLPTQNDKKEGNLQNKKPTAPAVKPKVNAPVLKKELKVDKVSKNCNVTRNENLSVTAKLLKRLEEKKPVEKPVEEVESYSSKCFSISVPNIDASDKNDPCMVSEYVQEIYKYLRETETSMAIKKDFLKDHPSTPKMRRILVDWMIDVQLSFKLLPETLYLAIFIVDQYLQLNDKIGRDNLQLVGTTALLLASKYEEISVPELDDFVFICDDHYSKVEIIKMERDIAKKLDFKFNCPLPIQFYRRCCKIGNITQEAYTLGKYILELTLLEHKMSLIDGSLKAAAAYCLASSLITGVADPSILWNKTLTYYTCYKYEDLKKVIVQLAVIINDVPDSKQQTAKKKYNTSKQLNVSVNSKLSGPLIKKLVHEANISI